MVNDFKKAVPKIAMRMTNILIETRDGDMKLKFTKMHGAGNDYVYVDARGQERDWPALSVAMSDRHLGVGSDGLILALPSEKADLRMRMFNADGSEGEMCGNGIRCLVSFAFDNGIVAAEKSPDTGGDDGGRAGCYAAA